MGAVDGTRGTLEKPVEEKIGVGSSSIRWRRANGSAKDGNLDGLAGKHLAKEAAQTGCRARVCDGSIEGSGINQKLFEPETSSRKVTKTVDGLLGRLRGSVERKEKGSACQHQKKGQKRCAFESHL